MRETGHEAVMHMSEGVNCTTRRSACPSTIHVNSMSTGGTVATWRNLTTTGGPRDAFRIRVIRAAVRRLIACRCGVEDTTREACVRNERHFGRVTSA